jgi:hypothetical protein
MATDIQLTTELETTWNNRGDITTISGDPELAQSFIISILTRTTLHPDTLRPVDIQSTAADIEDAVAANPRSEPPISAVGTVRSEPPISAVGTVKIDDEDGTQFVEYNVQTDAITLTLSTA